MIDFPDTFEKFTPSLVRSGKWDATKTSESRRCAMPRHSTRSGPGEGPERLRGQRGGRPGRQGVRGLLEEDREGRQAVHGFEGTAFDAAMTAFLAAVRSCSASPAKLKAAMRAISAPPGLKVTFQNLAAGVKAAAAGKDVNYEGAFSPVDYDAKGDIGSAVYEIWEYQGSGKIVSSSRSVPRLVAMPGGGGGPPPPARDLYVAFGTTRRARPRRAVRDEARDDMGRVRGCDARERLAVGPHRVFPGGARREEQARPDHVAPRGAQGGCCGERLLDRGDGLPVRVARVEDTVRPERGGAADGDVGPGPREYEARSSKTVPSLWVVRSWLTLLSAARPVARAWTA